MITDLDTALALPPKGFVREYVEYAYNLTAAPAAYHLGSALTLLAVSVPVDYEMDFGAIVVRPNLFTLLVGRSGDDMKSTAIDIAHLVLNEAAPTSIGNRPESASGLVDELLAMPRQLVFISEFGDFLASAQQSYQKPLKPKLIDAADCKPITRARSDKNKQKDVARVLNPRLSMLGGCAPPFLEAHTDLSDWNGGFLARWCVLYSKRERTMPFPKAKRVDGLNRLVEGILGRSVATTVGRCEGFTPAAEERWIEWYYDVTNRKYAEVIAGTQQRAPMLALKASLLYSWDFGPAVQGVVMEDTAPWLMDVDLLEWGIKLAELHLKSVASLGDTICVHADARLRRSVLLAIQELGGVATRGLLLARLKLRVRPVQETLDALMEEHMIERVRLPDGTIAYSFAGAAAVPGPSAEYPPQAHSE